MAGKVLRIYWKCTSPSVGDTRLLIRHEEAQHGNSARPAALLPAKGGLRLLAYKSLLAHQSDGVSHVPSVIISAMLLSQLSDLLRLANHNAAFWILALFGVFYALYRVRSRVAWKCNGTDHLAVVHFNRHSEDPGHPGDPRSPPTYRTSS
jgi:hypothetical protein